MHQYIWIITDIEGDHDTIIWKAYTLSHSFDTV